MKEEAQDKRISNSNTKRPSLVNVNGNKSDNTCIISSTGRTNDSSKDKSEIKQSNINVHKPKACSPIPDIKPAIPGKPSVCDNIITSEAEIDAVHPDMFISQDDEGVASYIFEDGLDENFDAI